MQIIAKTEKEQKILLTKQVAAREEATREKLHLLKEMLHKAHQEQIENKPLPFGQQTDGLFATHMGSVPQESAYSAVSNYTARDMQGEENVLSSAINGSHKQRPSDDTGSQNTALRGSNGASDNRLLHSPKKHRVRVQDYESQLPSGLLKTEQMQVSGELYSRDTGSSKPTVIPSEYVRCMANGEKFDARKMGLSSETFDTALLSMLNGGTLQVSCDAEFYDKFARSPPPRKRPGRRHLKLKGAVIPKDYQEQNEKFGEAWDPKAKVCT